MTLVTERKVLIKSGLREFTTQLTAISKWWQRRGGMANKMRARPRRKMCEVFQFRSFRTCFTSQHFTILSTLLGDRINSLVSYLLRSLFSCPKSPCGENYSEFNFGRLYAQLILCVNIVKFMWNTDYDIIRKKLMLPAEKHLHHRCRCHLLIFTLYHAPILDFLFHSTCTRLK